MIFEITAPLPPSDNSLYPQAMRRVRGGGYVPVNRRILSKEARKWAKAFRFQLMEARAPRYCKSPRRLATTKRPVFTIRGAMRVGRSELFRSDLSNRWKLILDTLSEYCGVDDRYCLRFGPFEKVLIDSGAASVQIEVEFLESFEAFAKGGSDAA